MPSETTDITSAPVTPVRLRRLLDVALLESAYGRGVHDRVPVEIVDLSDGSLVCEWSCERDDEVVGRRVRYASESDMWRELHELARSQGVPRTVPFYAARAWSSALVGGVTTATPAELELQERLGLVVEAELHVDHAHRARQPGARERLLLQPALDALRAGVQDLAGRHAVAAGLARVGDLEQADQEVRHLARGVGLLPGPVRLAVGAP